MAEFAFWGIDADCAEAARRILADGNFSLVPNALLSEPRVLEVLGVDQDFYTHLDSNRLFYVGRVNVDVQVPFNRIESVGEHRFAIAPGAGGRLLPQSEELKDDYVDCVARLKRGLMRRSVAERRIWIGQKLVALARSGAEIGLVVDGSKVQMETGS